MVAATAETPYDPWPWAMLPARLVLFALAQGVVALALGSWEASVAWWPLTAVAANLATIGALAALYAREGRSFWSLFAPDRAHVRDDLVPLAGIVIVAGLLAYFPNVWLATWLFGGPEAGLDLFVRPLPPWAAVLSLAFPLTIVFAELPCYFAYAMPRIERQINRPWLAVALPALFLALQHVALPLVFDLRFVAWRALMFVPLALFLGVVLRWRPQLLPYLAVVHVLLDLSVVALVFAKVA